MIWFRVNYLFAVEIEAQEVERLTERMVVIKACDGSEVKEYKESNGVRWFDNFDDAAKFATERCARKVSAAQSELNRRMRNEKEISETIRRMAEQLQRGE